MADVVRFRDKSRIENKGSLMLIRDLIGDLREAGNTAKLIGDRETQYLISIALEAAKEKFFLNYYETC